MRLVSAGPTRVTVGMEPPRKQPERAAQLALGERGIERRAERDEVGERTLLRVIQLTCPPRWHWSPERSHHVRSTRHST